MSKVSQENKKKIKINSDNKTTTSKINDGKCCRCVYRNKEKICSCKKSSNYEKHVARKIGCNCFKYKD